jgi:hypothetical protein
MTAAGGLPSLETSLLRGSAHMGLANLDVLKAERKRKDDRQRQTPGGSAAQGQPAPTAPPGLEHFNEAVVAFTEALEAERAQRQRLAGRLDLQRQVAVMAFWPMGGVGLNGTAGQWLDAIQVQRPCPEVWENHRTEAQLLLQRGLAHVSARAWGPADADLADALKNFPKEEAREQEPTILSYRAIAQVMLDQPREAVHLADRLTRGPQAATLTPDHLLTAARTYAIAATKTQVRKETDRIWERWGDDWRRAAMRNLELVVDRLPAAERKRFWDEKIRFDSSLDGLRADPQMEVQFRNLERRAAPGQVSAR